MDGDLRLRYYPHFSRSLSTPSRPACCVWLCCSTVEEHRQHQLTEGPLIKPVLFLADWPCRGVDGAPILAYPVSMAYRAAAQPTARPPRPLQAGRTGRRSGSAKRQRSVTAWSRRTRRRALVAMAEVDGFVAVEERHCGVVRRERGMLATGCWTSPGPLAGEGLVRD